MPTTKQKLRVAMIGSGFMGKAHSNAFRQVGFFFDVPYDLELKVICARDQERLATAASRWGWQETSTDWSAVVRRHDIDLVDVATPNHLHAAISIEAANAGKIVFCEKPLATSMEEAEAMVKAASPVPNLVWFNYRRVPAVALAKRMIDAGRLGQIYHYRGLYLNESGNDPSKAAGWRYFRAEAGSGASGDLLSHSLDLATYLNGPITALTGMTRTFAPGRDVDDAVMLLAQFANGSVGTFEASRYGVGCRNRNSFEIHGSRGMVRFDLEDMNRLLYYDASEAVENRGPRQILVTAPSHPYGQNFWRPGHLVGYEHTFIATLGDFLMSLKDGSMFRPNFADGLSIQRLLYQLEISAGSRQWVQTE
jgi:myo-inositol 2-dehydrogenase/D-chiro-inositol 1-dehydrogenase